MSRRTRMLLAAGIGVIALVGLLLPAVTSSAQVPPPMTSGTSNGSAIVPAVGIATSAAQTKAPPMTPAQIAQADATAVAQCAKPLSQRVGAWQCSPGVQTQAQRKDDLESARQKGALTASSTAVAASTGYCNGWGCWSYLASYRSYFSGGGYYGYGSTSLGSFHMEFEVTMSGAASVSKPFYDYTSRGTKSTTLSGNRLYISATYPQGNQVNGGAAFRTSPCGARGSYQSCVWPYGGYGSYENTTTWATIAHQANWTDPSSSYPGRWYFYAKSIKLLRNSSGGYTFQGTTLPQSPAFGGWSAS